MLFSLFFSLEVQAKRTDSDSPQTFLGGFQNFQNLYFIFCVLQTTKIGWMLYLF